MEINNNIKPRIIILGDFPGVRGGTESVSEVFAKKLHDHGYSILCASFYANRFIRFFDRIEKIILYQKQYDIACIDVFSGKAFLWAEAACWALRKVHKPYILTLHGGNLPKFAELNPHRVRRLLNSAVVVTAPSKYLQEKIQPYFNKIVIIPNPININSYFFKCRKNVQPKFVWLRTFHKIYNPQLAIRVIANLVPLLPNVQLNMYGPDKGDGSWQKCKRLVNSLDLSSNVILHGPVKRSVVPKVLNEADIFINTTNVDNTPVSVIEALASGLCVVSTSVGGIPYILEDGKDSLLVKPDDAEAMTKVILRLFKENGLPELLSVNGRKKVDMWDWSCVLSQWEMLFDDVIKTREALCLN